MKRDVFAVESVWMYVHSTQLYTSLFHVRKFTRGDASRNTEGSGLGLAIAKDLTKLMNGEFKLTVDGDLFKAGVLLERA